jgi:hypothetical protein
MSVGEVGFIVDDGTQEVPSAMLWRCRAMLVLAIATSSCLSRARQSREPVELYWTHMTTTTVTPVVLL